jgi:hypothetical protein
LDREIFFTLREAQVLIERWRQHYNGVRPHSALGYRPPAPEAIAWPPLARPPRLAPELAGQRIPELTSGWTNHWGQATIGVPAKGAGCLRKPSLVPPASVPDGNGWKRLAP